MGEVFLPCCTENQRQAVASSVRVWSRENVYMVNRAEAAETGLARWWAPFTPGSPRQWKQVAGDDCVSKDTKERKMVPRNRLTRGGSEGTSDVMNGIPAHVREQGVRLLVEVDVVSDLPLDTPHEAPSLSQARLKVFANRRVKPPTLNAVEWGVRQHSCVNTAEQVVAGSIVALDSTCQVNDVVRVGPEALRKGRMGTFVAVEPWHSPHGTPRCGGGPRLLVGARGSAESCLGMTELIHTDG